MPNVTGRVRHIAINDHKLSFLLDPYDAKAIRVVLYEDDPNTAVIPQMTMATRSWMLALLQTAFTTERAITAHLDAQNVATQIDLHFPPITINPDLVEQGSAKSPVNGPGPFTAKGGGK
jgi:hypothetical protein